MIAVEVKWRGAVYWFRVTPDECIVRALMPFAAEPVLPQMVPCEVVCEALRSVARDPRLFGQLPKR